MINVRLLIFAVLLFIPSFAAAELRFELGVREGFRSDELDWSIGGYTRPGNYVNVLSELSWDDLRVWQSGLQGEVTACEAAWPFLTSVLSANVAFGTIYKGENRDSDYAGNDRALEFSRSNNNADDGKTFDASIAAGALFDLGKSGFSVGPVFGYSWHEQQLRMTDGRQTVSNQLFADWAFGPGVISVPPLGSFAGLDSSYDTEWRGPWAGIEAVWKPALRWRLRLGSELHSVDYQAVANWNLRSDFAHPKSFEHSGDGYGVVFRADGSFLLRRSLTLAVGVNHGSWSIENGRDRTFFSNGTQSDTRLNEVCWVSTSLNLSLTAHF